LKRDAQVYGSIGVSGNVPASVILGPESYRRYAEENGFRQETLEKVIRLGQMMAVIAGDAELGSKLALKGGTVINLMTEPIRRLSVDLDFNYVGAIDREAMLVDKPSVLQRFRTLAEWYGYRVDLPRDEHGGSKFSLRYRNSVGGQDRIEIDVNWITRVPLGPLQRRSLWQPGGLERPEALLVSTEELIAGKLRALIDRVAARDVFDAAHLPELIGGDWPSREAKALFVLYSGTLNAPLTTYSLDRLDRLSEADFQNKLLPVLSAKEPTDRLSLTARAKEVLRPMLDLDEAQTEYVARLQFGEYRPELLLPFDLDLANRLKLHPALLWKAKNAKEFHSKRT
jgi:predicted nucleotidyltransferase component of viral defense system